MEGSYHCPVESVGKMWIYNIGLIDHAVNVHNIVA